jgi:hypothetical protein
MAPNLAASQRRTIHDMILSNELTAAQMANAAGCSVRAVKYIRSNLRAFGSVKAPWNGGGRPRSVTPIMLEALREYLLEKPDRYLDEMAVFLWDEFGALIPDFYNQPDAEGCWLVEESLPTSGQRTQRRSPRLLPIQPVFLPLLPPCLCRRVWV